MSMFNIKEPKSYTHEERASFNAGKVAAEEERIREQEKEVADRANTELQESLLTAISIVGKEPLEPVLFNLGLTVDEVPSGEDTVIQLSHNNEDGEKEALRYTTKDDTKNIQSLDTTIQRLQKLGSTGQEAATRLKQTVLNDLSNYTF